MVVPDLALICEIMLMAEGFQMSKILSRKVRFISHYLRPVPDLALACILQQETLRFPCSRASLFIRALS